MFKTKRYLLIIASNVILVAAIVLIATNIIPESITMKKYGALFVWAVVSVLAVVLSLIFFRLRTVIYKRGRIRIFRKKENAVLHDFIESLRTCSSLDDFYEDIGEILEEKGDCSVLFVDREKDYVLYNSPNRITCNPDVISTLDRNFRNSWREGYYFIGDDYGIVSQPKVARGFFITYNQCQLFIFCRYTRLFYEEVFDLFYREFTRFFRRAKTIDGLSEISELSSEWNQLAETQRSFLPPVMPEIEKLSVAAYYRPLVNVSGDYYTVLPISRTKTLLMLGDVSGKGLAASLVMGLVMNTVKILDNKEDLPNMIRAVDKAIKGMKLQDKYTVVFIGVVDTSKMTIRYVNASMSDPLIISKSPDGYKIKPLTSNCSVVGIIDIDDVEVSEQRLFRGDVILMATDGVSEVMDENGVELGDTQLYEDTIKHSAVKSPAEFINDVVGLVFSYNGDKKLRDDVTMMVAKVEG